MSITEADSGVTNGWEQAGWPDKLRISDADGARVAILMCTYNGAAYIAEQLESFAKQSFTNWTLHVSDDGSTDGTLSILADHQRRWGEERLVVYCGPGRGFAANFVSLVKRPEVSADYFAFSDQDDIWFSDKLARSIAHLTTVAPKITPALYCSSTRLVDAEKNLMGTSAVCRKLPSFQNALVQSIAGANTMLINSAARNLLKQLPENVPVIAHDWLTYLLVTGCGGHVIYDSKPTLDYRQHGGNLIGANATFGEKLARLRGMLSGRFAQWNDANLTILEAMAPLLTERNRRVMACFRSGRRAGLIKRVSSLRRSGVYRQTASENLILVAATFFGKV